MNFANAIAKVRFASARAQKVTLNKADQVTSELLCLEPGQSLKVSSGQWNYYVITGSGSIIASDESTDLRTGNFAATEIDESHAISNDSEQRLVILAVGS